MLQAGFVQAEVAGAADAGDVGGLGDGALILARIEQDELNQATKKKKKKKNNNRVIGCMVQGLSVSSSRLHAWHGQGQRVLLTSRINRLLRWTAVLFWIGITLQGPGILQPLLASIQSLWKASLRIGSFALTVENIFLFFFVLWAALTLSRLARFVLVEEVFPKLRLERGLPYAVTTMLHYVLLVLARYWP